MPRTTDPAVLDILQDLLAEACAGRLKGLFVVAQRFDGPDSATHEWATSDADDLAYEARTGIFMLETDPRPERAPPA